MNQKYIFAFVLIAGILSSAVTRETACNRVRSDVKRELKKSYGLELDCIGSGNDSEDPSKYESLIFGFDADGELTIDEAREYAVASTEDILNIINAAESLAPYLIRPFQPDNMLITINFHGPDGWLSTDPFVSWVAVRSGCIFYYTFEKGQSYNTSSEYAETYEDALVIFQGREPDNKSE